MAVAVITGSQVDLTDSYEGGQVARGGRAGIFGALDVMDLPFSTKNYTEELSRNQQARSVADVLQKDPIVRVAKGFGNSQELYVIREMPWYNQMLSLSQPLHFGDYGGLPLKILWAILDVITLIVLGSGLYLWITRRKPVEAEIAEASSIPAPAE